jgi:energy-coupling factor transport system ATP-binding protein
MNLAISDGECVGMIGAEGTGKSTLLHILGTLFRPDGGIVKVDGRDVWKEKSRLPTLRARIGFAFQFPEQQFLSLTLREELAELAARVPSGGTEAAGILTDAGMDPTEYLDRSPFSLSMGEARRISLASMLFAQPDALLLDEPTVGLDRHGLDFLARALKAEQEKGTTILLVTHDLDLLAEFASRIVVLGSGTIVCDDDTGRVLTSEALLRSHGYEIPEVVKAAKWLVDQGRLPPGSTLSPGELAKLARKS